MQTFDWMLRKFYQCHLLLLERVIITTDTHRAFSKHALHILPCKDVLVCINELTCTPKAQHRTWHTVQQYVPKPGTAVSKMLISTWQAIRNSSKRNHSDGNFARSSRSASSPSTTTRCATFSTRSTSPGRCAARSPARCLSVSARRFSTSSTPESQRPKRAQIF